MLSQCFIALIAHIAFRSGTLNTKSVKNMNKNYFGKF